MPLLHKKPFTPNEFPLDLKDNEEVFFCKLTREIFRDYDEFCERIILCNSLVWSCSLTGRSHLTFQEALASEEKVKKLLKSFPMELRIPVLYLASLCERKSLVDLAEDVYSFAKDRYFIGETVDVSLSDGTLGTCHILAVIPPTQKEIEEYETVNTKNGENRYWPPASLYKYEVETMDDSKELTVTAEQIFRKKSAYNKDKNRLYIKQFVHLESGFWKLKESSNTKYGISKVKFEQIFCGDPPDMVRKHNSPLKRKSIEKGKRQETLNKYFKQASGKQYMSPRRSPKKGDLKGRLPGKFDKQRKRRRTKKEMEEARNRTGKELLDTKRRAKAVKKEERLKRAEYQREWNRKREDLECEDLKELPVPHLVETKIPVEYFGDVIMIMEFLKAFEKILNVKDFFPHGISFDIMERALVEQEVAGPLCDLLQLLLAGIFDLQDQEADEIRETDVKITPIFERGDANTMKLLRLATAAEAWVKQYHAAPLSQLVLDTSTLSEIVRLHLLSSGSRKKDKCTKWRYQARGGYCRNDDPAITLKLNDPHIIQHLSQASVCDLKIADKVTLLNCLMNQILTYSAARDIIEEGCDKARQCRIELRSLNAAETKREKEEAMRQKEQRKKEDIGEEDGDVNGRSLRSSAPETNKEMIRLAKEMSSALSKTQLLPLGMDRAFRRFWIFPSLPGLFVENHSEENVGTCLLKGTPHFNGNVTEDGVAYVRRIFEEGGDKENFSEEKMHNHQMNSPSKKLLTEKNGADSPLGTAVLRSRVKSDSMNMQSLTCWGDPNICPVHSESARRISWAFFKEEAEINILIESLNRRGIRERRLRQALIKEKDYIFKSLPQCPVEKLNSKLVEKNSQVELRPKGNNKAMKAYDNANLNHPAGTPSETVIEQSLRDFILETEEKISMGALGVLKVNDRKAWRTAIENHGYDKQCKKLTWGGKFSANSQGLLFDDPLKKEEDDLYKKDPDGDSRSSSPSLELNLQGTLGNGLEPVSQRPVVFDLASAILQIEQCIEHKYLKRPLGLDPKERDKAELKMPSPALERWEAALMESTSFPQLFLHLSTLDNSVIWARSALNAFCKICRGSNDPENMLLCDTCNKGHHLYCLKPKLTKVPPGDWHCPRCQPKEKVKTVKKKRQLFCDGSDEESEAIEQDTICKVCSDNGAELVCETCDKKYHLKCVVPPVRKVPKSKWFCHECRLQNSLNQVKSEPKVEVKHEPKKEPEPEKERDWRAVERVNLSLGDVERSSRRRCSKAATAKISHFAKQLRSISWEGEEEKSENKPELRESSRRRTRRTQEPAELVQDLPLDNAALQEILDEIMHHKEAWPFLRPVTKAEVPDYHLYIKRPMDFGTIKHKLNMLEYRKNSELFADAELLFNNCYKYNEEGSEVYRAGEKLEILFEKLCKERNLMASNDGTAPPTSKRSRTVL